MKSNSQFYLLLLLLGLVALSLSCKVKSGPSDLAWDEFVSPHRHFIQMNGYKMHCIDMGQGEPVVMVHGFASSTYCWHENVKAILDSGFRVILIDLPGQGQTEVPPKDFIVSGENVATEVIKLMDMLQIERFALIGSSMGGGLTLYMSWQYPERITRAVVIDPASFDQEKPWSIKLFGSPVIGDVLIHGASRWTVKKSLKSTVYNKDIVDDVFVDEYARPMAKPGYKGFIARLFREFFSDKLRQMPDHYEEISVPLLIMWGDKDSWVPPEFGPRLQKLVPGSRFVSVQDCGHMPHLEHPEITNPLLVEFLLSKPETVSAFIKHNEQEMFDGQNFLP